MPMPPRQPEPLPSPTVLHASLKEREAELADLRLELQKTRDLTDIRKELVEMKKNMGMLVEQQGELQTAVLKVNDGMASLIEGGAGNIKKCTEDAAAQEEKARYEAAPPANEAMYPIVKNENAEEIEKTGQDRALTVKRRDLTRMFEVAEGVEEQAMTKRASMEQEGWTNMTAEQIEMRVDTVMACVIIANTIFVGVSMDYNNGGGGWMFINVLFSLTFIAEVVIKIRIHSCRGHFWGSQRFSNILDAIIIAADVLQITLEICFPVAALALADAPSASVFRICRVAKLARLLRFMQADGFKDLMEMIHGIIGGMTTLFWAMVLFITVVYVVALMFRELLGRKEKENIYELFNGVPRSIFTTFRCSFGDCSAPSGVPIFEYVNQEYGAVYSLFYGVFVFTITIGLFNVISAIFVESTLAAAQALETKKRRARLQNNELLFSRVARFIRRILHYAEMEIPDSLADHIDDVFETEVPCELVDEVVKDDEAIAALDELDIHPSDRARLSDIFDPDNGGTVAIPDIATGIRRLRGEPRRSDIICVDMMVRSLQDSVAEVLDLLKSNKGMPAKAGAE